jgi:hypothetical protein
MMEFDPIEELLPIETFRSMIALCPILQLEPIETLSPIKTFFPNLTLSLKTGFIYKVSSIVKIIIN